MYLAKSKSYNFVNSICVGGDTFTPKRYRLDRAVRSTDIHMEQGSRPTHTDLLHLCIFEC